MAWGAAFLCEAEGVAFISEAPLPFIDGVLYLYSTVHGKNNDSDMISFGRRSHKNDRV